MADKTVRLTAHFANPAEAEAAALALVNQGALDASIRDGGGRYSVRNHATSRKTLVSELGEIWLGISAVAMTLPNAAGRRAGESTKARLAFTQGKLVGFAKRLEGAIDAL